MHNNSKYFFYFLSLLLYLVFVYLYRIQSTSYSRSNKLNMYFDKVSYSPDALFLGDSHMAYSIKNKYLNTSDVSFAFPGNSVDNWFIYFNKLVSQNKQPKHLILESGNHILNSRRQDITPLIGHLNLILSSEESINFIGYKKIFKLLVTNFFPFILENSPIAVKNNFKSKKNKKDIDSDLKNNLDFIQKKRVFSADTLLINERIDILYSNEDLMLAQKFNEFVEYVNNNGTNVILLNMPLHSFSQSYQDSLLYYNSLKSIKELDFYDLTRSLNDSVFEDIDHIKLSYSKEFTKSIYEKIDLK